MTRLAGLGALAFLLCSPLFAQQRVGSGGHALDSNLRAGSGGYNRGGGRGMKRNRYSHGSGSLYTVGRSGEMVHNPHNAFGRPRYGANQAAGGAARPGSKKVRYQGWGP